ncbi:MAG: LamG-like jellyroll fold domain-containing protein [Pirellulaceae bacterium]
MKSPLLWSIIVVLGASCLVATASPRHEGPDPVWHWIFNTATVNDGTISARLGKDGAIIGDYEIEDGAPGILLKGNDSAIVIAEDLADVRSLLPTRDMTISARVSINQRRTWGSVICLLQDNGGFEKGWVLGYDQRNFYFGLSTTGADDGDGFMTYLKGSTDYETGKFYDVVAVFDGAKMQLFVNGRLDAETDVQSGDILYPENAPFVIGSYRDDNENFPHKGRVRDVAIYDLAARAAWVEEQFGHNRALTERAAIDVANNNFEFVVPPFLQMATRTSIVAAWQTTRPATSIVRYGETAEVIESASGQDEKMIHHVTLENLNPDTQYFYQVESVDSSGATLQGDVLTFQTAPQADTPFAFAIISDTQGNPHVAGQVAEMAWGQRPGFLIHPGDLVSTGTENTHWTEQFFPSMHPLIGRVPIFPVLGNHEVDARNYYDYFQLPDPEYYYEFQYGNAHFFMIDSNKNVDPESEQYQWLDTALAASTATWKFVVHHHPVFSSDENDYGNLWKTNQSTRGDSRVRVLTELYDRHDVDIVWNGHIHSYERTWPILGNQATTFPEGTVYMVTGGGGGGLETPGPFRPFFQNNVRRGHHYCMAHVNGDVLEFKAFDLEGRLFDYMKLNKRN